MHTHYRERIDTFWNGFFSTQLVVYKRRVFFRWVVIKGRLWDSPMRKMRLFLHFSNGRDRTMDDLSDFPPSSAKRAINEFRVPGVIITMANKTVNFAFSYINIRNLLYGAFRCQMGCIHFRKISRSKLVIQMSWSIVYYRFECVVWCSQYLDKYVYKKIFFLLCWWTFL